LQDAKKHKLIEMAFKLTIFSFSSRDEKDLIIA